MKISPIGIRSYQQLTRPESPAKAVPGSASAAQAQSSVTISPQSGGIGSRLAVQAQNVEITDALTVHERKALELILMKIKDATGTGAAYGRKTADVDTNGLLGRLIDVKV
jgi:hypothetical protein